MAVSGTVRMNLAGLSDADLSVIRGVVTRALKADAEADPNGLLAAIDDEVASRRTSED